MFVEPTTSSLAAFLRRVRTAVLERKVFVTGYAREGAEALDWNEDDIITRLRLLTARDWLRTEASTTRRSDIIWVFTPDLGDEAYLWIRLVERSGIVVVSFHRG